MTLDQVPAGVWSGLAFGWLALSIASRRWLGKPLMAGRRPGCVFAEGWASARAGTGLLARLGTARNCIHVQVTADALQVHPHFPFSLGFMPEVYDLDHVVPLGRIRSATILGGRRAKAVEVVYQRPAGDEGKLQLLLKQAEAFVQAVGPRRS